MVTGSDGSNKLSPSNKRSLVPNPVAHRPLRDRVVHLLALKPYRKPELLLWLERERAGPKDKADLASVLDEVRLWTGGQVECMKCVCCSMRTGCLLGKRRGGPGLEGEEPAPPRAALLRFNSELGGEDIRGVGCLYQGPAFKNCLVSNRMD